MSKANVIMKDASVILAARLISSFAAFAATLAAEILCAAYFLSFFTFGIVSLAELKKLHPASLKLRGV